MMPIFLVVLTVVAGLLLILFLRYISLNQKYGAIPDQGRETPDCPAPDFQGFVKRFQEMIQLPTISWTDHSKRDTELFSKFQQTLADQYPNVHKTLDRKVISEFGLVYHWKGKNPDKKPVLFLAHYDVVPAEEKGDESWDLPPFSGTIEEGILWGRGTLDIKNMVAFYMETAETYLNQGWQPERDIYFAFGGDEEIGGSEGARKMAALFKEQGLEFEFVMDEGGVIAKDQMAFLKGRPAALVGLAEKGFVTFKIKAVGESGHSAMPVKTGTAIGRLAKAVVRLEGNPSPSHLVPVMRNMLERYVPFVSTGLGIIFANLWLFSPLVKLIFSKNRVTDSLVRTTQAVTVFQSGEQENILPGEAVALVNHRILPGDTIEALLNRHHKTLKDGELTIEDAGHWPSNNPIQHSEIESPGFQLIKSVLARTHPDAIVTPYLVNGSTDSKYYAGLTGQVLRFTPLVLSPEDVASIHGVNEKVSLENLEKGLEFYIQFFNRL